MKILKSQTTMFPILISIIMQSAKVEKQCYFHLILIWSKTYFSGAYLKPVYVVRTDAYAVNDYSHLNLPSFMYITVCTATTNATMGCMRVCTFQTSAKLPVYCIVHKYTSLRRFYHSHNSTSVNGIDLSHTKSLRAIQSLAYQSFGFEIY